MLIEKAVEVFLDGLFGQAAAARLAEYAQAERDRMIAAGQTVSSQYRTYVDGVEGAAERAVRPDGLILYDFDVFAAAIPYALEFCRSKSPVDSGAYKNAWFALAAGVEWAPGFSPPVGADVFVTNDRPYHRKISNSSGLEINAASGVLEGALDAVKARYGKVIDLKIEHVHLDGGWILRRDRRWRGRILQHAGEPISYPALKMVRRR